MQTSVPLSATNKTAYEEAATAYKNGRSTKNRDRLVFMAIAEIDVNFGYYQKNRRFKNNLFQSVMDILEVGAATAISITNGARPKSIIADGLGFLQGSRARLNKNLRLLEQQILINKMIEKRSQVLTRILDSTRQYGDDQYSFERAYLDIVAYYEAGTMDGALSSLATDTGSTAQNAQAQLAQAKSQAGITLAPSADQIRVSRENADVIYAILDNYESASNAAVDADNKAAAAQKLIDAEKAKSPPDQVALSNATTERDKANQQKADAESTRDKELKRLRDVFKSIDLDPELSALLEKLPARYPNIPVQQRLNRIRAGTAKVDDYGYTILQFLRQVVDAVPDNPTVVQRTKNILDSVK